MELELSSLAEQAPTLIIAYGTRILLALAIFLVGRWLARLLTNALKKRMARHNVDGTVATFSGNLVYYVLLVVVIIAALGQLGLQTASFIAIVGAASLAVGFALQGSLANFATGFLLILFRPCKVGDYVEAGGGAGVVSDISIFATTLLTPDNKTITIAVEISGFHSLPEKKSAHQSAGPGLRVDEGIRCPRFSRSPILYRREFKSETLRALLKVLPG